MNPDVLSALAREGLMLMVLASLPPILASMAVSVLMSFLQAVMQLQDNTLGVVPRLAASVGALVVFGPWIAGQLMRFTEKLLLALPGVTS